jgi:hypothetical protein
MNATCQGKVSNIFKLSLGPLYFTIGVNAKVELKSSIPIGSITEISSKGFTIGVKAENENIFFFNLPLYGPDLSPRPKKDTYQLGRPICNPWANFAVIKYYCFDEIHSV